MAGILLVVPRTDGSARAVANVTCVACGGSVDFDLSTPELVAVVERLEGEHECAVIGS